MRFWRGVLRAVLTTFLLAVVTTGQTPSDRSPNIYAVALVEAVHEMERQWGGQEPYGNEAPLDFKRPVVSKDRSVVADYPETSEGRTFEYLTDSELRARRIQLGMDFYVLFVNPATVDGARVKVVVSYDLISLFRGKLFRRRLLRSISSWGTVYFRLDEPKKGFQVDEVKLGGI